MTKPYDQVKGHVVESSERVLRYLLLLPRRLLPLYDFACSKILVKLMGKFDKLVC